MSAKDLENIMHSSNLVMKPFTRAVAFGCFAYMGYCFFWPSKTVQRIQPNYQEYRRLKGLPEIPLKHPGWLCKDLRIVPPEEDKKIPY